jgi:hypothetical protein
MRRNLVLDRLRSLTRTLAGGAQALVHTGARRAHRVATDRRHIAAQLAQVGAKALDLVLKVLRDIARRGSALVRGAIHGPFHLVFPSG